MYSIKGRHFQATELKLGSIIQTAKNLRSILEGLNNIFWAAMEKDFDDILMAKVEKSFCWVHVWRYVLCAVLAEYTIQSNVWQLSQIV